jgi:RNA polymerase sigma factor (sigma-70 family)
MFTTRITLLEKVRQGNNPGWDEFAQIYKPLIFLRGRDRGLDNHELDDLAQQVFLNLYEKESVQKYENDRGRFRDYLRTIIDRRAFDLLRKRKTIKPEDHEELSPSEDSEMTQRWETEWKNHLYHQALEIIRPEVSTKTLEAFELSLEHKLCPEAIAKQLDISVDSVYVAKHRVLKRLAPIIRQLEKNS